MEFIHPTGGLVFTCHIPRLTMEQIELVDFGATREYSREFMDSWLRLLQAAASDDRDACIEWSLKLGYLTGQENKVHFCAIVRIRTFTDFY